MRLVYMITLYGKSEDPREFINPKGFYKNCAVLSISGAEDYNYYDKQNINDTILQCQVHKHMPAQ